MATRTDTPNFMASEEFIWRKADGGEERLVARVGLPYAIDDHTWACACELEGHGGRSPDLVGGSSMQAISLAIGYIRSRLVHLISMGERLRYVDGGGDWGLDQIDVVFGRGFPTPRESAP